MEGLDISNMRTKKTPVQVFRLLFKKYRRRIYSVSIDILNAGTFCQFMLCKLCDKCSEFQLSVAIPDPLHRFHNALNRVYQIPVGLIKWFATFTAKLTCLAFLKYHETIIDDGFEHYYHRVRKTINRKELAGFSALHVAVLMNKWSLVHRFVKYGANRNEKTQFFDSPLSLYTAISVHAPEDVIRALIGPNSNVVKQQGHYLRHLAVKSGHWDIMPLLLEKGVFWDDYYKKMPKPDSLILQAAMTVRKSMAEGNEDYDRLQLPPLLRNYVNLRNIANCIMELKGADNTDDNQPPPSVCENLQRYFLTNQYYQTYGNWVCFLMVLFSANGLFVLLSYYGLQVNQKLGTLMADKLDTMADGLCDIFGDKLTLFLQLCLVNGFRMWTVLLYLVVVLHMTGITLRALEYFGYMELICYYCRG